MRGYSEVSKGDSRVQVLLWLCIFNVVYSRMQLKCTNEFLNDAIATPLVV